MITRSYAVSEVSLTAKKKQLFYTHVHIVQKTFFFSWKANRKFNWATVILNDKKFWKELIV
jgi:hypothetical protein